MRRIYFLVAWLLLALSAQGQTLVNQGNLTLAGTGSLVLSQTNVENTGSISRSGTPTLKVMGTAVSLSSTTLIRVGIFEIIGGASLTTALRTKELNLTAGNLEIKDGNLWVEQNLNAGSGWVKTQGTGELFQYVGSTLTTFPLLSADDGTSTGSLASLTLENLGTADTFGIRAISYVPNTGVMANPNRPANAADYLGSDVVEKTWVVNKQNAGGVQLQFAPSWSGSDEATGFDRSQAALATREGATWKVAFPNASTGSDPYQNSAQLTLGSGDFLLSVQRADSPALSPIEICYAEPTTITAPTADMYLWSNGETTQSITVSSTVAVTYSITLTVSGQTAQITTLIDVPIPELQIAVSPSQTTEDDDLITLVFTFTRNRAATCDLAVNFLASGTATYNDDYYLVRGVDSFNGTSGTLTIPAGSLSHEVIFQAQQDAIFEPNETITLTIQGP
ncbi:MAG: hypothetical protein AAF740_01920 [Bacteroidota bacterium]